MKRYESLKERFNEKIFCKGGGIGGFIGNTLGSLTGGLIGRDPNKAAKREAERQREAEERRIKEAEATAKREKEFSDKLAGDVGTLEGANSQQQPQTTLKTTTDFTKSLKLKDEEDKLKKMFSK